MLVRIHVKVSPSNSAFSCLNEAESRAVSSVLLSFNIHIDASLELRSCPYGCMLDWAFLSSSHQNPSSKSFSSAALQPPSNPHPSPMLLHRPPPFSLAIILILLHLVPTNAILTDCYYPNGLLEPLNSPCNPTANASACCGQGQRCFSNGVCEVSQQDGHIDFVRASCTDPTWKDPACLRQCMNQGT